MKNIFIPQLICSVFLIIALFPDLPYSYFVLLRWVCCATFGFLTFCLYKKYENNATLWYLGAGCLLYNPILPIHLTREIWLIINGLSIVLLFLTILHGKKNKN